MWLNSSLKYIEKYMSEMKNKIYDDTFFVVVMV